MINLNVEQFHKTASEILKDKEHGRQQGRTMTLLYLMLSRAMYVEHPEGTNFAFITHNSDQKYKLAYDFFKLLQAEGVEVKELNSRGNIARVITESGLNFHFSSKLSNFDWARGMKFKEIYCDEYVTKKAIDRGVVFVDELI